MDKASVTSSRLSEERVVYGGVWAAPYWKILRNTKYKCSERIQMWYDLLCQIMAETSNSTRRSPLSAVNQS